MPLKTSVILFAVCSLLLSACGHGPVVTSCISSPKEDRFRCFDEKKDKNFQVRLKAVDNWVCLSPLDTQSTLNACKAKRKGPRVNACVVSSAESLFRCFDQVKEEANQIKFEDTENYVCMSPFDFKAVIEYCKSLRN